MEQRRFKPSFWPTLAAVAGIALTCALGNWQLGRGNEKAAFAQRIEMVNRDQAIELPPTEVKVDDVAWRRVEVSGTFEPKYSILIDNRILHGAVGYHVVTPLRIAGGDRFVLVNRGWVAGTNSRATLPQVATPPGVVRVSGLATVPGRRYLELSSKVVEGNVWENLTIERFRAAVAIAIQPVVIQQGNETGDGLKREWSAPDLGIDKHYGYAFQWFALAAAIMIFYVVHHVRKRA